MANPIQQSRSKGGGTGGAPLLESSSNGYKTRKQLLHILTRTQAYRPQKLYMWMNFDVQSEFEVEHAQFLHLDPKHQEEYSYFSLSDGRVTGCRSLTHTSEMDLPEVFVIFGTRFLARF